MRAFLLSALPVFAATASVWASPRRSPALPPDFLPVPLVRQAFPHSCGPAALASVLYYWGVFDGGEGRLYAPLKLSETEGADPRRLAAAARDFGLDARWKENTTIEELREALRRRETVIADFQAWPEEPLRGSWKDRWEDGHYAVLVGLDEAYAYFMDPATPAGYAYIPLDEFQERWHDYEGSGKDIWRHRGLAVFILGQKPLPSLPAPLLRLQ